MTQDTLSNLPARLKDAMEEAGMNQTDLSVATGLTDGAISRWLSGERSPTKESCDKLASALGVSTDWLSFNRGPRKPLKLMVETRLGSAALEEVLRTFDWPLDVEIATVDKIVAAARAEAHGNGQDRPESSWLLRVRQLLREFTSNKPPPPRRPTGGASGGDGESEEIREHRKKRRRD